ncbi:MAG TPA: LysE family translocator [Stellaceae bacterium]
MTILDALLTFTLAAGVLTITPGLDTALVLRTAAIEGSRRGMIAALGVGAGCLCWGLAASVGLGALLAVSQLAYNLLRIIGACYLIYIGIAMWRGVLSPRPPADTRLTNTTRPAFLRGLLTNLLNPKVGIFYVTFLPLFVPAGVNVTLFSMALAAIHVAEGLLWFWLLTRAVRTAARLLRRPGVMRGLDGAAGTVMLGFGAGLLIGETR